ncbi:hypothetical protein EW146_g5243 [Bondarzewia mesenterica]|uniref:Uncharacterized protein n=1 Tax=Bondarzewia mesenterica TaxID=1095465 RepID=A0A4S4LXV9_9AGAM|nr:hypothetical protein EW146_g5243 [Bondarzewia mesenterica]
MSAPYPVSRFSTTFASPRFKPCALIKTCDITIHDVALSSAAPYTTPFIGTYVLSSPSSPPQSVINVLLRPALSFSNQQRFRVFEHD